jgi:hypothetical protein
MSFKAKSISWDSPFKEIPLTPKSHKNQLLISSNSALRQHECKVETNDFDAQKYGIKFWKGDEDLKIYDPVYKKTIWRNIEW